MKHFSAGQIKHHLRQWQNITSDQCILQMVAGDIIEFDDIPPTNSVYPNNHISNDSIASVKTEIDSLLAKRVLVPCENEIDEFISPIFTVPKPDNQVRLILNLKSLNAYVTYYHFKMDSIHTVISMVTPNCWIASIDLKDAYYSVPHSPGLSKILTISVFGEGLSVHSLSERPQFLSEAVYQAIEASLGYSTGTRPPCIQLYRWYIFAK